MLASTDWQRQTKNTMMDTRMHLDILCLTILFTVLCTGYEDTQEYCSYETFHAECQDKEIIMITNAQYGRMKIGKCVKSDLGQLGCSADATSVMDKACSGKRSCSYFVGELMKDFREMQPCSLEFSSYLEVSYECISVAEAYSSHPCMSSSSIELPLHYGYISSSYVTDMGWGTMNCPWRLEANAGQTVNVSLISFEVTDTFHTCKPIGFATDTKIHQNITLCQSSKRREHILVSVGHIMIFQFLTAVREQGSFLLQYSVVGCADLVAPEHAWHRRVGDIATIGCQHQNKTWRLQCNAERWHGVVGTCSETSLPFTIIIICTIAATVLAALCIIIIALRPKCCCNKNSKQEAYPQLDTNSIGTSYGYASNKAHTRSSWACTFKSGADTSNHIWETPLPEPSAPPAAEHMLAATTRHPNPMETSITSSGGDYTWPTRFISLYEENDDYTVPINLRQSAPKNEDAHCSTIAHQGDYMIPSDKHASTPPVNPSLPTEEHTLPTDTFKRQLSKILSDNASSASKSIDQSSCEGVKLEAMSDVLGAEYAVPNSKRQSQVQKQEDDQEGEYILPSSMRPASCNEKCMPSAHQI